MSGVRFNIANSDWIDSGSIPSVGVQEKIILMWAAASNHRAHVDELTIGCDGQVNTEKAVRVQIGHIPATISGDAVTPQKVNPSDPETIQITALENASAVPATFNIIFDKPFHPQGGFTKSWRVKPIPTPGGGFTAVRIVTEDQHGFLADVSGDE